MGRRQRCRLRLFLLALGGSGHDVNLPPLHLHGGQGAGDVEQLLNGFGGLGSLGQPCGGLVVVDLDQRGLLARVVTPDLLDIPTVPWGTAVHDHDPIYGRLLLAHPDQSHLHGHRLTS